MTTVLITGGAGFIGSHTADALIERGYSVRILDILDPQIHGQSESFPEYMHPEVECFQGDVGDPFGVTEALDGVDVVFHFAALTGVGQSMYDIRNYVDTNCKGTATLLEAIMKRENKIQRFILASSRAVYGEGTHECPVHGLFYPESRSRQDLEDGRFDVFCPHCGTVTLSAPTREDRPLLPISLYGLTKKQQEEQCKYIAQTFNLPVTILRYFNVYGSRQSLKNPYTGVVSIFYNRMIAGNNISIYERGIPGRDFVHISDVVRANLLALECEVEPGTCVNIGTGTESRIVDIATTLAQACRREPDLSDLGEYRVGDIHSCYSDLERAFDLLGYKPQVELREGMEEFIGWAKGQDCVDLYQKTVDELEHYGLFANK